MTADGIIKYKSSNVEKWFGWKPEDLINTDGLATVHPDDFERVKKIFSSLLEEDRSAQKIEYSFRCGDGRYKPIELNAVNLINDPLINGVLLNYHDISDRKRAEDALVKSEQRYKKAQSIGHVGNWEYNLETAGFWGSDEAKRIFGFDPHQHDFTVDEVENCIPDRVIVHQALVDLIEQGKDYNIEYKLHPGNSGETRIAWSIAELVRDSNGTPLLVMGVIQDITERKKAEELIKTKNDDLIVLNEELNATIEEMEAANELLIRANNETLQAEEALKQTNVFLHSIIESPKDIDIFSLDINGNYTAYNCNHKLTMERLYGTEVITGANLFDLITEFGDRDQAAASFKKALSGEHFTAIQEFGPPGDKSSFEISYNPVFDHTTGKPSGVTLFKIDITEKVRLESMLFQSQKMEAIGTLAGGIAHDFNNILGGIVGYIQLAALDIPHDQKAYRYIDQVLKACYRARDLIQQILTFSRKAEVEKKPLPVELIVKEVVKLLKASFPATIEIEMDIEDNHLMIYANPTHIHQVLMNLCTNAKHAIGNRDGRLTITVEKPQKIDRTLFSGFDLVEDAYVLIKISDTGTGMLPNVIDRVFEPYFTTKDTGEGTGLGLAVVHRIITDHNGGISIDSRPGEGTTFTIALPHREGSSDDIDYSETELPRGKERVLFVDDEVLLVDLSKEILEKLGYDVVTTNSPEEALEIIRRKPEIFDLLITDMTMPKMSGELLAAKIHEFKPELPVILCTGFSESITRDRAEKVGINAILFKPVTLENFSRTIRSILDS